MRNRASFTGLSILALVAVALAGCGGGSSSPSAGSSASSGAGGTGRQMPPGTSGSIAAISGTNLQVQNTTDGQVGVTYSPTTTFTRTVAATAADVKVGVCVTAVAGGGPGSPSNAPSTPPSAAPTGPVLARTVTISSPVNGQCANRDVGGFGRGAGGTGGSPQGGSTGTGTNSPRPGGGRGGFGGFGAFGKVTSRTPTGFVVQGMNRSGAASTTTVTTDSTTTYMRTAVADAKALSVGECVTALGKPDDTGTVAATAIAIRLAGPQGCSVGFRGGRQGGGQGAGGGD